ncbi:hypothetical protein CROQUDRAFT_501188 [Cronartium quercuum f. sp. fusiforme G11]|uniref:Uncharacterized protein n=1 Tax=Cronartium quercuum f. sp. fusiforme G11 TaxID=708437 RepID=A0A9P6NMC4_9BASI|nr:hypothetical protein CROQUDRAFT_501188 [Cronartium quercuum f. sp. fusiforme G11]
MSTYTDDEIPKAEPSKSLTHSFQSLLGKPKSPGLDVKKTSSPTDLNFLSGQKQSGSTSLLNQYGQSSANNNNNKSFFSPDNEISSQQFNESPYIRVKKPSIFQTLMRIVLRREPHKTKDPFQNKNMFENSHTGLDTKCELHNTLSRDSVFDPFAASFSKAYLHDGKAVRSGVQSTFGAM